MNKVNLEAVLVMFHKEQLSIENLGMTERDGFLFHNLKLKFFSHSEFKRGYGTSLQDAPTERKYFHEVEIEVKTTNSIIQAINRVIKNKAPIKTISSILDTMIDTREKELSTREKFKGIL